MTEEEEAAVVEVSCKECLDGEDLSKVVENREATYVCLECGSTYGQAMATHVREPQDVQRNLLQGTMYSYMDQRGNSYKGYIRMKHAKNVLERLNGSKQPPEAMDLTPAEMKRYFPLIAPHQTLLNQYKYLRNQLWLWRMPKRRKYASAYLRHMHQIYPNCKPKDANKYWLTDGQIQQILAVFLEVHLCYQANHQQFQKTLNFSRATTSKCTNISKIVSIAFLLKKIAELQENGGICFAQLIPQTADVISVNRQLCFWRTLTHLKGWVYIAHAF